MTNQTYSSYCGEDRHDSCMSLVPSSKGGCDCNCHDFNKEENKKFDNSGKPFAKFDGFGICHYSYLLEVVAKYRSGDFSGIDSGNCDIVGFLHSYSILLSWKNR